MRPSPHVRDREPPPVVRAVTGVVLGLLVGAVAALATPRRSAGGPGAADGSGPADGPDPAGGPGPADGPGEPVAHVP